ASFLSCFRFSSTSFFSTSYLLIFHPFCLSLVYLLNSFSNLSSALSQPRVWPSRDSSLCSCSCVKRRLVPPSASSSSTVTMLIWFSQSSSSAHCQVKTIFLPG